MKMLNAWESPQPHPVTGAEKNLTITQTPTLSTDQQCCYHVAWYYSCSQSTVWFGEGWSFSADVKTEPNFEDKSNTVDTMSMSLYSMIRKEFTLKD